SLPSKPWWLYPLSAAPLSRLFLLGLLCVSVYWGNPGSAPAFGWVLLSSVRLRPINLLFCRVSCPTSERLAFSHDCSEYTHKVCNTLDKIPLSILSSGILCTFGYHM